MSRITRRALLGTAAAACAANPAGPGIRVVRTMLGGSAGGKGIEVYLGTRDGLFENRSALQKFESSGDIRFTDHNDDGLPDFILFDPQSIDGGVRIGRNLGVLESSARQRSQRRSGRGRFLSLKPRTVL